MTKNELLARANERAMGRYGVVLSAAKLNDLIKDGLVPAATRSGNIGQRPIYEYGFRSYRRLLQVARLAREEVIERNAIIILFYLRGYGIHDWQVRDALATEFSRQMLSAGANVRSSFADNNKTIPNYSRESLLKSMGPLDSRLRKAGWGFSEEIYIGALRVARQQSFDPSGLSSLLEKMFSKHSNDTEPAIVLEKIFSGWMERADDQEGASAVTSIEKFIRTAHPSHYATAYVYYWLLVKGGVAWIASAFIPDAESGAAQTAIRATEISLKNDPKWAAILFVICLLMAASFSND